jgi:hypothetical protein
MDEVKALQGVADVLHWPGAFVRMLVRSLFKPWAVHRLCEREWAKEPQKRFQGEIPPLPFWLIAVGLPYLFCLTSLLGTRAGDSPLAARFVGLPWPARLALVAILLAPWVGGCTRALRRRSSANVEHAYGRLLATHYVALAPAYLFLLGTLCAAERATTPLGQKLATVCCVCFAASLAYAHVSTCCCEVRSGWLARVEAAIACLSRSWFYASAIIYAGVIVLGLARR